MNDSLSTENAARANRWLFFFYSLLFSFINQFAHFQAIYNAAGVYLAVCIHAKVWRLVNKKDKLVTEKQNNYFPQDR